MKVRASLALFASVLASLSCGELPSTTEVEPQTAVSGARNVEVIDLGVIGAPGSRSQAYGVNNRGQVTGLAEHDAHYLCGHTICPPVAAFFGDEKSGLIDVGALVGAANAQGRAINSRGDVLLGWVLMPDEPGPLTYVWSAGTSRRLQQSPDLPFSSAWDVNDRGEVVGGAWIDRGFQRPVRWHNGGLEELELPAPYVAGGAFGISNSGLVVGWVSTVEQVEAGDLPGPPPQAVLWQNGGMEFLPSPPGDVEARVAYSVNSRGDMTGSGIDPTGANHWLVWAGGEVVDVAPNAVFSRGKRVNELGAASGYVLLPDPDGGAPRYYGGVYYRGELTLLPAINGTGHALAYDINDRFEVVGISAADDGSYHATLWRVRPSPGKS